MNKRFWRSAFLLLLALTIVSNVWADDYQEYAAAIRQDVWSWDLPDFQVVTIPEEYKHESGVILACHERIIASRKSKLKFNPGTILGVRKGLTAMCTIRSMVFLNDKAALDEYSELSFKEKVSQNNLYAKDKLRTVLGARIIKPDGTVVEVNMDEAVNITQGKKEKDGYSKIAVSNLEVGDVLDYFMSWDYELEGMHMPEQYFTFSKSMPLLSYTIWCEIDDNLTVEYRSLNGAPSFQEQRDENNNVILSVSGKNLPKREGPVWSSVWRDAPMIRLNILNNSSQLVYKPSSARKAGVYANPDIKEIQKDAFYWLRDFTRVQRINYSSLISAAKKTVRNYQSKQKELSKEELADLIYDALLYQWGSGLRKYEKEHFIAALMEMFKDAGIDYMLGVVSQSNYYRMSDILSFTDLSYILMTPKNKALYTAPKSYVQAGRIAPELEGETIFMIPEAGFPKNIKGAYLEYTIPVSSSDQNYCNFRMSVKTLEEEKDIWQFDRRQEISYPLSSMFHFLLTYEDWNMQMRNRLGIEETLSEEYSTNRQYRKYADDWVASLEKGREKQKESFKTEIELQHEKSPKELLEHEIISPGVTRKEPVLVYRSVYTMENCAKKAGNDYVLFIGMLFPTQSKVEEHERIRKVPIDMEFARQTDCSVKIEIPAGYKVNPESLRKLNIKRENSCGSFISSAILEGEELHIRTVKRFEKAYLPVENWEMILEIQDASIEFGTLYLVLEKI